MKSELITVPGELPASHEPYTDKYFIRTKEILEAEDLNPTVTLRVFARREGVLGGIENALEIIDTYSPQFFENGGKIWHMQESINYLPKEPMMLIEGKAQDIVELETMYLGAISHIFSVVNGALEIDYNKIRSKSKKITELLEGKPWSYFGARHYHYSLDEQIGAAAMDGGAVATSTDIGSSKHEQKGIGTIPHYLILNIAYKYGKENATLESAKAFDRVIDPAVPRYVLIDTFNQEINDSLAVARELGDQLTGYRIDTCGENIGQGGTEYFGGAKDPTFETGNGVTIELTRNLRLALIKEGYGDKKILLSSGFGNEEKLKAFMSADKEFQAEHNVPLFDGAGIGGLSPGYMVTSDICAIDGNPFSKTGREMSLDEINGWKDKLTLYRGRK